MKRKKYPSPRPTAVDLFSGAGGMSLGFEQAGFDIVLGIDRDGHHVATHERNFPYGKAYCGGIEQIDRSALFDLLGSEMEIDAIIGGPPCQGFSHMGLRDVRDPRNSLIGHFVRIVLEVRPRTFVMENVPGLASGRTRAFLDEMIETAESQGYAIAKPVRILDAADFGVPQRRRRLFIIGVRKDVAATVPYPTRRCGGQPERPTVVEAIEDLPNVEDHPDLFKENVAPYIREPESFYARVARGLAEDASDLSRPREWNPSLCTGCLRTKHTAASVRLYEATPPGQTVPGHKLPRLHSNGIAPTLRAGSDSSHGSYTAPRPIHPLLPRCITSREAARLHGFPDWFAFYPLKWHAYRQIGNAVCPPVARAIGRELLKVLRPKWTTRGPAKVNLRDRFVLPKDRPRTLKRIPQMQEFPPIVEYLFEQAYDRERKRLRKPTFTFGDVREAIEMTGANLHWVREDTILQEIARTRRVREIIAAPLTEGFSIRPIDDGKAIGEFVPKDTPGTVDDKEAIHVRIDEIHDAVPLSVSPQQLNGNPDAVLAVLSQHEVLSRLWGSAGTVSLESESVADASGIYRINVKRSPKARARRLCSVLTCKAATIPPKSKIIRIAREQECDDVTLLISATTRHIVAIQFSKSQSNPVEVARIAFELSQ